MRLRSWLFLLCLWLPAQAGPDVSYQATRHFTVEPGDGGYQLHGETQMDLTFHSKAATDDNVFKIYEAPRATLTGLHAECRGKALAGSAYSTYTPESRYVFIESGLVHRITFPGDLKPGDSISYSYRETFQDIAQFPLVQIPALDQVERYQVVVDHPRELKVDFEVFCAHGELHPAVQRDTPTRTSLLFEHLAKPEALAGDPYPDFQAAVLIQVTEAATGKPVTCHTPASFGRWCLEWMRPAGEPDQAMRDLLVEPLGRAASPREKAAILFNYVKSEIRYVADEGGGHDYLPHPCAEVLAKKWGDCKDKANLLSVLGRLHGISIYPVLVGTEPGPAFAGVHTNLFDHAICALDDGGRLVFMDPTDSESRLGDPPAEDQGATAFLLDPANPRYVQVTAESTSPSLEVSIDCDLARLDTAKARLTLRHTWRDRMVFARKVLDDKAFEDRLKKAMAEVFAGISFEHFRLLETQDDRLVLTADADLSRFFADAGQRLFAPRTPFIGPAPALLDRVQDPFALEAAGPVHERLQVDFTGAGAAPAREETELGKAGGPRFLATLTCKDGRGKLTYGYDQPFRLVPQAERADFLSFCDGYLKANRNLFAIERGAP